MDVGTILLDILVVLVAAKLAAEIAERINVPAVVGEIVAGVVIGPSILGFVGANQTLNVLGELGVILLLLGVGMEMDLAGLGAVGRRDVGRVRRRGRPHGRRIRRCIRTRSQRQPVAVHRCGTRGHERRHHRTRLQRLRAPSRPSKRGRCWLQQSPTMCSAS